jgi:hypothetical protein
MIFLWISLPFLSIGALQFIDRFNIILYTNIGDETLIDIREANLESKEVKSSFNNLHCVSAGGVQF